MLVLAEALLMGARLEKVQPSALASVWFEPNTGSVKGRTAFVGRTLGAYLYVTGSEVVYAMAPAVVEPGAKVRQVDWRSVPLRIPVWPARPGLFTSDSSGKGLAAALNQDGSVNSVSNPAGEIAVLWGTGGGVDLLQIEVFVDGMETEVLYAGSVGGLWQLNVRIPEFAVKGEIVWRAGERESQDGVFVVLRP